MSQERIDQLVAECRELENEALQIALLEEAIRLCDALGDTMQSYRLRFELIQMATFGGYKEKALVAYAWCLAEFDRDPEAYNSWDLLWRYKWVLGSMTDYPNISKSQIVSMQDDFQRRLRDLNFGTAPAEYLRWKNFMRMGDFEQAMRHYAIWQGSSNDLLDDCAACVANSETSLMIRCQRNEQALTLAEPLLDGRLWCKSVPLATYASLVRVYLRLERLTDAETMLQKSYRRMSKSPAHLDDMCELQLYLIRQRRFVKAIHILERCLPWAVATADLAARYTFYWSSSLLLAALVQSGKRSRKLKLPATLACYRDDSQYDLATLADWFAGEAQSIAAAFNRRNCNDYCTQLMEESRELAVV